MLIHVFEPLFHAEEANKALADVRLASEASHLSASVIFVVAGYASPEVTALLGRAAHDVIVFDGERFDSQFSAVLDKLRRNLARDPARQLKALKTELESVKATLQQLASVRAHETVNVDAQVRRMVEAQSADRVERRRDDVRLAWAKERRTLEAKIEEARKLARKRDFDELEALRSKADLAFWALVRWSAIGTVFAAALAATVSYIALYREVSPDALLRFAILFFLLTFGVGVLTSAVLAANSANVSIRLRMRALAAPVASLEELDRLVFRYGNPPTDVIVQLLSHPNPHIRYAGALHAGVVPIHAVIAAINAEPARILRSVMAHALANAKDLDAIFGEVSARRTPELGYTIEGAAGRGPLPPEQVERFPGPLRALAFIVEWKKFKSSPFGNFPYARLIRDALSTSAPNGPPGPPLTWDPLGYRLPEQVIREAMRDLSPFEEPGIGTLTALECLDLVDECYLYVNQIRYYQESATTAS
jgi:hypothetical protein